MTTTILLDRGDSIAVRIADSKVTVEVEISGDDAVVTTRHTFGETGVAVQHTTIQLEKAPSRQATDERRGFKPHDYEVQLLRAMANGRIIELGDNDLSYKVLLGNGDDNRHTTVHGNTISRLMNMGIIAHTSKGYEITDLGRTAITTLTS